MDTAEYVWEEFNKHLVIDAPGRPDNVRPMSDGGFAISTAHTIHSFQPRYDHMASFQIGWLRVSTRLESDLDAKYSVNSAMDLTSVLRATGGNMAGITIRSFVTLPPTPIRDVPHRSTLFGGGRWSIQGPRILTLLSDGSLILSVPSNGVCEQPTISASRWSIETVGMYIPQMWPCLWSTPEGDERMRMMPRRGSRTAYVRDDDQPNNGEYRDPPTSLTSCPLRPTEPASESIIIACTPHMIRVLLMHSAGGAIEDLEDTVGMEQIGGMSIVPPPDSILGLHTTIAGESCLSAITTVDLSILLEQQQIPEKAWIEGDRMVFCHLQLESSSYQASSLAQGQEGYITVSSPSSSSSSSQQSEFTSDEQFPETVSQVIKTHLFVTTSRGIILLFQLNLSPSSTVPNSAMFGVSDEHEFPLAGISCDIQFLCMLDVGKKIISGLQGQNDGRVFLLHTDCVRQVYLDNSFGEVQLKLSPEYETPHDKPIVNTSTCDIGEGKQAILTTSMDGTMKMWSIDSETGLPILHDENTMETDETTSSNLISCRKQSDAIFGISEDLLELVQVFTQRIPPVLDSSREIQINPRVKDVRQYIRLQRHPKYHSQLLSFMDPNGMSKHFFHFMLLVSQEQYKQRSSFAMLPFHIYEIFDESKKYLRKLKLRPVSSKIAKGLKFAAKYAINQRVKRSKRSESVRERKEKRRMSQSTVGLLDMLESSSGESSGMEGEMNSDRDVEVEDGIVSEESGVSDSDGSEGKSGTKQSKTNNRSNNSRGKSGDSDDEVGIEGGYGVSLIFDRLRDFMDPSPLQLMYLNLAVTMNATLRMCYLFTKHTSRLSTFLSTKDLTLRKFETQFSELYDELFTKDDENLLEQMELDQQLQILGTVLFDEVLSGFLVTLLQMFTLITQSQIKLSEESLDPVITEPMLVASRKSIVVLHALQALRNFEVLVEKSHQSLTENEISGVTIPVLRSVYRMLLIVKHAKLEGKFAIDEYGSLEINKFLERIARLIDEEVLRCIGNRVSIMNTPIAASPADSQFHDEECEFCPVCDVGLKFDPGMPFVATCQDCDISVERCMYSFHLVSYFGEGGTAEDGQMNNHTAIFVCPCCSASVSTVWVEQEAVAIKTLYSHHAFPFCLWCRIPLRRLC